MTAAERQAAAAIAQAQQSLVQTSVAQQGLIATTRPWVQVSITPDTVAINNQLTDLTFDLIMLNVGHSPANHILIEPSIYTDPKEIIIKHGLDLSACDPINKRPAVDEMAAPEVIFPQQSYTRLQRYVIDTNKLPKGAFCFGVEVCVYYVAEGSSVVHATSIIFNVTKKWSCDPLCGNMFESSKNGVFKQTDLEIVPEYTRISAD